MVHLLHRLYRVDAPGYRSTAVVVTRYRQAKLGRWLQTLSGRGSDGWFEVRLIRFTYCKNFNKRQVSVKRRRRINTGLLLPVA